MKPTMAQRELLGDPYAINTAGATRRGGRPYICTGSANS